MREFNNTNDPFIIDNDPAETARLAAAVAAATAEPETVVVTRHAALVAYLTEQGIIPAGANVLPRATPDDVKGRHVVGVLPLHLAALAVRVTVVPLNVPDELRGVELSLEQVRRYAGPASTYAVHQMK